MNFDRFLSTNDSDDNKENKMTDHTHAQQLAGKQRERELCNIGQTQQNAHLASPKKDQPDCVTIEYIKEEALSHLWSDKSQSISPHFLSLLRNKALDQFLISLLFYLSCFFEKKILNMKPKARVIEQSVTEQHEVAKACAKLDLALKQLAVCYSHLILGVGLPQQHHMACGRSRTSLTYRDRKLFECLYSFICYAAWLTFGQEDLLGIQQEVGRLMRSDAFNPTLRVSRNESEEPICRSSLKQGKEEVKGHTPPGSSQRKPQKRPPLSRMVTQCSPLLMAVLPSSAWHRVTRPPAETAPPAGDCDMDALKEQLTSQLTSARFGILGKPCRRISSTTFKPMGEENEQENGAEDGNRTFLAAKPIAVSSSDNEQCSTGQAGEVVPHVGAVVTWTDTE